MREIRSSSFGVISVFILVFLVPNIAFAAWWNPFTWRIFYWMHKEETPQVRVETNATATPHTLPVHVDTPPSQVGTEPLTLFDEINAGTASSSGVQKNSQPQSTSSQKLPPKLITTDNLKSNTQSQGYLGMVSSVLGFSIKYPYKEIGVMWGDDERFQIIFYIPPSVISSDASTAEKLSSDLHNIRLFGGLSVTVIEDNVTPPVDLKDWITKYIKKEDGSYGNREIKVLSENISATTFAGHKGYLLTRSIEGSIDQKSPHYTWKELFIRKDKYIYRIHHLAPSADTLFPRSGAAGKEYLKRVDTISEKVLSTFVFDGSTTTAVSVPKVPSIKLSREEQMHQDELLAALRKGPFFDENAKYPEPRDPCVQGTLSQSVDSSSVNSLRPSPGIYLTARRVVYIDPSDHNYEAIDFHVYDDKGNHTGPMPSIPGLFTPTENWVRAAEIRNYGSARMLSIDENFNGRIELLGKMNSGINLEIRGEGNSCGIAEIFLPITKNSIATIPTTKDGDLGPVSLDIDGDGREDIVISLVHPLLPSKQLELDKVMALWNTIGHMRSRQQ